MQECIRTRPSRNGKYLSVDVGPVMLRNGDEVSMAALARAAARDSLCHGRGSERSCEPDCPQVVAIYAAMKKDERMVWYL